MWPTINPTDFLPILRADREDKDAVVERFWGNYVDLVEADPANHGMDYVHCYLVVEKE